MTEWTWFFNLAHWIWFAGGILAGFVGASMLYGAHMAHAHDQLEKRLRQDMLRKIERIGGPRAPAA